MRRALAVVLILLAAVAATSPAPVALEGRVTGADGAPAAGVMVVARDTAAKAHTGTLTRADGRYRIATTLPGPFEVFAIRTGDTLAVRHAVGTGTRDLELTLADEEERLHPSSWWLSGLPEGETKRRFILDCTGCHQFNETRVMKGGVRRTHDQWAADVTRMLGYAGATSGFPVIAAGREPDTTAAWITSALARNAARSAPQATPLAARARITEYDMPVAQDLPHDVAVDRDGRVVVTGMFTAHMFVVDPGSGAIEPVPIPVPQANPRAVEIDADGAWWVLLGNPKKVARRDPASGEWTRWDIGMYPHSVAIAGDGRSVWFNGHFTKDPEHIGRLDPATGATELFVVPKHPTLAAEGGPVPYEQRIAPDGTVWLSELQGNRMIAFDPQARAFRTFTMPEPWSGPRRFDIGADGTVWIPAYSGNALVKLDPRTGGTTTYPLPAPDCLPYIARVSPATGHVWIGTGAADAAMRFDPASGAFDVIPLPTRGATVRHMAIDPRTDDVWLAYGASPAVHPARIARITLER